MRPGSLAPAPARYDGPPSPPRQTAWQQEIRERIRLRRKRRVGPGDLPLFGPLALVEEPRGVAPVAEAPAVVEITPAVVNGGPDVPDLPLHDLAPVEPPSWPVSLGEVLESVVAVASTPVPGAAHTAARWHERLAAGVVDVALLAALFAVVGYFTSRIAPLSLHMGERGLWLLGFAGLLAAFYAGCFTGTVGQTPGKMLQDLRVVDQAGRAPGFMRALGRALLGVAGVALLGVGTLPAAFDAANRALHDRAFRTRVIRK